MTMPGMLERPDDRFGGYGQPTYTTIPDLFLDHQMQDLSGTEIKVMLYIFRHTYGFHKTLDAISLSQFARGIITRDGRRLDRGAGVSRRSILKALTRLAELGYIFRHSRLTPFGQFVTVYELNLDGRPHYIDDDIPAYDPWNRPLDGDEGEDGEPADAGAVRVEIVPFRGHVDNREETGGNVEKRWVKAGGNVDNHPGQAQEVAHRGAEITPPPVQKVTYRGAETSPTKEILNKKDSNKTHTVGVSREPDVERSWQRFKGKAFDSAADFNSEPGFNSEAPRQEILSAPGPLEAELRRAGLSRKTARRLARIAARQGRDASYIATWRDFLARRDEIANPQGYLCRMVLENSDPPGRLRPQDYTGQRSEQVQRLAESLRRHNLI